VGATVFERTALSYIRNLISCSKKSKGYQIKFAKDKKIIIKRTAVVIRIVPANVCQEVEK